MSGGKELWVVGQYRGEAEDGRRVWDFQGVFESEVDAVKACRTDQYFIAPVVLGESLPHELMTEWPGVYYPHRKESK